LYLLLVDNSYISPRDIKILLDKNRISCDVVTCSSSKVLLDLSEKLKPDIVIIDFDFFSDDPIDIVNKLRHTCPPAYILAFVERDHYDYLYEAVEEGVNDYLVKPLQHEDVMLRIKMGLQRAKPVKDALAVKDSPDVFSNIKYFSRPTDAASEGQEGPGLLNTHETFSGNPVSVSVADEEATDQFENLAAQAEQAAEENPREAVRLFYSAIDLYREKHLHAAPVGVHELFVKCVFDLSDILKEMQSHDHVIRLCEMALVIDYFEEGIHTRLIEAMLAKGMTARARAHYDKATSTFYHEMGIKPSMEMRKLYEQIGLESGNPELNLSKIQDGLKSKDLTNGALFCDTEQFRYSYKLEQLRCERSGQSVLLCMFTLISDDYTRPPDLLLQEVMQNLQNVIMSLLRKGDLFTRWNEAQFLLLLPGLNREQAGTVMTRIEQSFLRQYSLKGLQMQKKVETLLPLEGDSHFN
jgi:DNA-binding response OmpR family regulator